MKKGGNFIVLKLTATLEVFKNRNGYHTGVIKAWDKENKNVKGKVFMDVILPSDVQIEEGQTLTLELEDAYLNAYHVDCENEFTKLKINVGKCKVISVFPEVKKKVKKSSKKVSK